MSINRKNKYFALPLALILFAPVTAQGQKDSQSVDVTIDRGSNYSTQRQIGPVQTTITPHMAVWLETSTGAFVGTVYVSLKDGKQDFWVGSRPHPLPVWEKASRGEKMADVVTGPSPAPAEPQVLSWSKDFLGKEKTLVVRAEINQGFDFNAQWPDDGKNPWGQPALEYAGTLGPDLKDTSLVLLGQGRPDGTWVKDLNGIDSAKNLIRSINVRLR